MTTQRIKQAAARSAARQKARVSPPPPVPSVPAPAGVEKVSPRGTKYRVYTIPLSDLPAFLDSEGFVAKSFFHYKPEEDTSIPQDNEENRARRYRSGFVLGVRRRGEEEEREL